MKVVTKYRFKYEYNRRSQSHNEPLFGLQQSLCSLVIQHRDLHGTSGTEPTTEPELASLIEKHDGYFLS